jgi:hypothetical protein
MSYIITIIAAVLFSYHFVVVAGIGKAIKRYYNYPAGKRLKPFDCTTCMAFWMCILLLILPNECSTIIATLFGAAYLGGKIR